MFRVQKRLKKPQFSLGEEVSVRSDKFYQRFDRYWFVWQVFYGTMTQTLKSANMSVAHFNSLNESSCDILKTGYSEEDE